MVLAFYAFATTTLVGGLMTVISRNPVHSVLWLILAFLSSAGLFVLLGAEFIAMLLMIVYVGAVAVLFLFVVMMLDIDFSQLKAEMAKYMPLALVGLGLLIYDTYFILFQLAGLILLVAMIGAILLTLRHRQDIRRQDILAQMYRDPQKAMELKDVKPGQGL
jgi:NADH-quinone oxidoreductase subunit J